MTPPKRVWVAVYSGNAPAKGKYVTTAWSAADEVS
jgi:hypothetical protein